MSDEGSNLLEAIMGQVKPQELRRKSHAPMPEILTGDLWSVLGSPTGQGATNVKERIIVAPDDPSAGSRMTRFHELTHVMISPEVDDLEAEAEEAGAHLLALQAAEDARVHATMRADDIMQEFLDADGAELFTDKQRDTIKSRMAMAHKMGKLKGAEHEVQLVAGSLALAATDTKIERWADEIAELCEIDPETLAECRKIVRDGMTWDASKEAARVLTHDVLFGRPEQMSMPGPGEPGGESGDGDGEPVPAKAAGVGDKPERTYTMAGVADGEMEAAAAAAAGEQYGDGEQEGTDGQQGQDGEQPEGGQGELQSAKPPTKDGQGEPGAPGDNKAPEQTGKPTVTTIRKKTETVSTEQQRQKVKQLSSKWVDWTLRNAGESGKSMRVQYRDAKQATVNSGQPSELKRQAAEQETDRPAERVFHNPIDNLLDYGNHYGRGGGHAVWGDMEIIRPPLREPLKKVKRPNKSKTWVATDESGRLNRRVSRIYTDGKVLRRKQRAKRKKREGAILIDASGSMGLNHGHVQAILEVVPMATVAHYCSRNGLEKGQLYVIAERGRMVRDLKGETKVGGGNVVDGPALEWLGKQRGPRVWVSDGIVTGKNESMAANIYYEAHELCVRHKIIRVPTLEMLLDRRGFNYKVVS